MALDAYLDIYLDSNSQLAAPPVVPEWVAGGLPQATISNSFFQKDDANLLFSGGLQSWRSTSTNSESYLSLPSSPIPFSSHNLSISGSSAIDVSYAIEQAAPLEKNCGQVQKRQRQQQQQLGVFNATPQPPQTHYLSLCTDIKQEHGNSTEMPKKPRLDGHGEDFLHQQIIQHPRKDSMQLQGHNPHLPAWIQHYKMRNQQHQKILQSIQQMQGVDMQQQQQQMRNQLQQQGTYELPALRPSDTGICSRRLMQYLYHQRHRPPDNAISYWRKFVAEYYAPFARKRWCLSLHNNVGGHAVGGLPQAAMETWHCDICGSRSGRGFEAAFEVLPRLHKINFESGVIDELLFVDLPQESRFSSGLMMLEYGKAVQESVYEKLRVVHEGQLRIIFSHDLKILSWEFCVKHHEELLPRQLVAPQVNQLVQAAQKYQNARIGSRPGGFCAQYLQENCNMFLSTEHQLATNLGLQLVDDFGFSKNYVRHLQIAEVVDSMEDLMIFVRDSSIGPIESLKNYPQAATRVGTKRKQLQLHGGERPEWSRYCPSKRATNVRDISILAPSGHMAGSEGGAFAMTAQYPKIMQQKSSFNSNSSSVKQDSCLFSTSFLGSSSLPIQCTTKPSSPGITHSLPPVGSSSSSAHSYQGSQNRQQCMIQKLLEEMMNNSSRSKGLNGNEEEVLCGINTSSSSSSRVKRGRVRNELGYRDSIAAVASRENVNMSGRFAGRDKSSKAASSSKSSGTNSDDCLVKREPDLPVTEGVKDVHVHGLCENDTLRKA